MHSDEEIERAAQRFEQWADDLDPETAVVENVEELRAVEAARRDEAILTERVAAARASGQSWNRIALALGVSRQAARQRFSDKIGA